MHYQDTSREAWESFLPKSAALDRAIMAALDAAGNSGLICQEIENQINRSHQAVSGNLRHLVEKGLVKSTVLRGKTESGRRAIKWVTLKHFDRMLHGGEPPPATQGAFDFKGVVRA